MLECFQIVVFFRRSYTDYFGGVVAISPEHFARVNGFSNHFYGWGGEDDDFYQR